MTDKSYLTKDRSTRYYTVARPLTVNIQSEPTEHEVPPSVPYLDSVTQVKEKFLILVATSFISCDYYPRK